MDYVCKLKGKMNIIIIFGIRVITKWRVHEFLPRVTNMPAGSWFGRGRCSREGVGVQYGAGKWGIFLMSPSKYRDAYISILILHTSTLCSGLLELCQRMIIWRSNHAQVN